MNKFSVVMSVYMSDSPIYFVEAVNSLLNQTKLPDEILIIADGPLSEKLDIAFDSFKNIDFIKLIKLD